MKVSRKVAIGFIVGVGVLAIIGFALTVSVLQDVSLSQEMIQEKIDSKLPMEKYGNNYKLVIKKIDVEINSRPVITMAGSVEAFGKTMNIELETAGDLQYRERALFFRSPGMLVKSLSFSGVEMSGVKKNLISVGASTAASLYLNNFPLYKIKGTKGWLIGAAIKSVDFGEGVVNIHLSLFQLTISVLVFIFVFLLSVMFVIAIMLNPELFGNIFFLI
jgi:hypothetical protein